MAGLKVRCERKQALRKQQDITAILRSSLLPHALKRHAGGGGCHLPLCSHAILLAQAILTELTTFLMDLKSAAANLRQRFATTPALLYRTLRAVFYPWWLWSKSSQ